MPAPDSEYGRIMNGELNAGLLFVDTKKIYLDARTKAAELGQPALRVSAMFVIVEMIGRLLRTIKEVRLQITRADAGLKGFDADLAGLQQRYRNLYHPFFEGGIDPPAKWTEEQWQMFEEDLEGPIL